MLTSLSYISASVSLPRPPLPRHDSRSAIHFQFNSAIGKWVERNLFSIPENRFSFSYRSRWQEPSLFLFHSQHSIQFLASFFAFRSTFFFHSAIQKRLSHIEYLSLPSSSQSLVVSRKSIVCFSRICLLSLV